MSCDLLQLQSNPLQSHPLQPGAMRSSGASGLKKKTPSRNLIYIAIIQSVYPINMALLNAFQRRLSLLPAIWLFVLTSYSAVAEDYRTWTSKDGREIVAKGVSVSLSGVTVKRSEESEAITIPFAMLTKADSQYAIQNLPVVVNDDVRVEASTRKQRTDSFQRDTGSYAVSFSGYSYGLGAFSGIATATPIMETVKESGRTVEVTISSFSGPGIAAVEIYTVKRQGSSKDIDAVSTGVYLFEGIGSQLLLETSVVEDFTGWVVLVRSLNTGRIVGEASSMNHFVDYVKSVAPEVVDFSRDDESLRDFIRKSLEE